MGPTQTDHAWNERCASSLGHSRERRRAARSARHRRLRLRGGGGTLAVVALMVAVTGGGVAVGHSTGVVGGGVQTGLLSERLGSGGSEVAAVQRALGMPEEAIDGNFGSRTTANVRLFQTRHGLLVDGIVGPQTRTALGLSGGAVPQQRLAPTETVTPTQPEAPAPTPSEAAPEPEPAPAPAPAPAPQQGAESSSAPAPSAAPAPQQSGTALPGALRRIAQCESGGNPGAVGGGGAYRGKYQFTRETWRGLGGSGDPATASEAEQDRLAAKLYGQSGSAPWGACG